MPSGVIKVLMRPSADPIRYPWTHKQTHTNWIHNGFFRAGRKILLASLGTVLLRSISGCFSVELSTFARAFHGRNEKHSERKPLKIELSSLAPQINHSTLSIMNLILWAQWGRLTRELCNRQSCLVRTKRRRRWWGMNEWFTRRIASHLIASNFH